MQVWGAGNREGTGEKAQEKIPWRKPGPRWRRSWGRGAGKVRRPHLGACGRVEDRQLPPASVSRPRTVPPPSSLGLEVSGGRGSERRAPGAPTRGKGGQERRGLGAGPGGSGASGRGRGSSPAGGRGGLGAALPLPVRGGARPLLPLPPPLARPLSKINPAAACRSAAAGGRAGKSLGRGLASQARRPHQHRGQRSGGPC